MTNEQWGVRVPTKKGEEVRRALLHEGVLDLALKVLHDGESLVFPVLEAREGISRYFFEDQPGRITLPRHELVGGIAIMQDNDPKGAASILASRPSLHSVLFPQSEVSGKYRIRDYMVLAGTDTTLTEVNEHGHRYKVDLANAYFSARLSTERQRIAEKTRNNEYVLDMFTGVGPFAITLAPHAAFIVAADFNPRAVLLLIENIRKNKAANILPVLADARRLRSTLPWQFDRIIMNLPLAGTEFLVDAFKLIRRGGTIHFYSLVSREGEHIDRMHELGATEVTERMVRSYSPGQWHAVYDVKV